MEWVLGSDITTPVIQRHRGSTWDKPRFKGERNSNNARNPTVMQGIPIYGMECKSVSLKLQSNYSRHWVSGT